MNSNSVISILAGQLGAIGGRTKSMAKSAAARRNGKLGGRPVGSKDKKPRKTPA